MTKREIIVSLTIVVLMLPVAYAVGVVIGLATSDHSVGQYAERVLHVKVMDDSPLFDCRTMGNHKCGGGTRYTFLGFQ